jgi:glutamate 5-kinase
MSDPRRSLRDARRVVIKVGSRALVENRARFDALTGAVQASRASSREFVVVSSGAIALGLGVLGLSARPKSMAMLQAAAAAGQTHLMQAWERAFAAHSIAVAQVLLTHADLADRDRYLNARAALEALIELGAVPIINENDTVAVDEIRFGDNDQLAAMVATLVGADLLVLLTDVEGLLDAESKRVPIVAADDPVEALLREGGAAPNASAAPAVGTGGMRSKLDAARRASRRGVPVVIASARQDDALPAILRGDDLGTLFLPAGTKLASRKHWIAYTLKPHGAIVVDAGAEKALRAGKSLLPAGVIGVRGDFEPSDAIAIVGPSGIEIARGLSRYATRDVARLAGAKTAEIEARLGHYGGDEIVHRDDLVVM